MDPFLKSCDGAQETPLLGHNATVAPPCINATEIEVGYRMQDEPVFRRQEAVPLIAIYAIMCLLWIGFADGVAPNIIAAAYNERSLSVLNWLFKVTGRFPSSTISTAGA